MSETETTPKGKRAQAALDAAEVAKLRDRIQRVHLLLMTRRQYLIDNGIPLQQELRSLDEMHRILSEP